ncbi:MAG: hypothetical protein OIF50_14710 [Flavobacteriaceae bacterium]|nr:hypothetical protein [Flavobacteriaceae bacterium]
MAIGFVFLEKKYPMVLGGMPKKKKLYFVAINRKVFGFGIKYMGISNGGFRDDVKALDLWCLSHCE